MKTKMLVATALVCVSAACAADSKGEQWTIGENNAPASNTPNNESANSETANSETANSETANNETANNETPANSSNGDPGNAIPLPRGGLTEGDECEVTLDCAAGLECVDVSEFEEPTERVCAAPECFCPDPEVTYCREGRCALHDVQCVIDGCPDGFQCGENVCYCDSETCEGGCASDDHCGWDEMCIEGACQDAHCEDDSQCPARYVCGGRHSDRLCTVAGTLDVGESCNTDTDCVTGYCYLDGNVCVRPCQANAECGARECAAPDHFDLFVPYCRAPQCGDCADDEFCNFDGTCSKDPCPEGECQLWDDV